MDKRDLRKILLKQQKQFFNFIKKENIKEIEGVGHFLIKTGKNYSLVLSQNPTNFFSELKKQVFLPYSKLIELKKDNIFSLNIKKKEVYDYVLTKKRTFLDVSFSKLSFFNRGLKGIKEELNYLNDVKINYKIEDLLNDKRKAYEQIIDMYYLFKENKAFEEQIYFLLSLGVFGINKKELETNKAISTYDSTIANFLEEKIEEYESLEEVEFFYLRNKGNTFLIFLIPSENFEFELVEVIENNGRKLVFKDYERLKIKVREPNTSGAFFASKLAVLEYLEKIKRKGKVVIFRLINNYQIHLGVVLVRESVREALKNKDLSFKNKEKIIELLERFNVDWRLSSLLKNEFKQKRITDFIL